MNEWLKPMRVEQSLTQQQLANAASIAPCYYSMIESGRRRPSVEIAIRIAEVMGFDWKMFYEQEKGEA